MPNDTVQFLSLDEAIAINALKRFVADEVSPKRDGRKVTPAARTQDERDGAAWFGYAVAMNRGRPREALGLPIRPVDPEQYLETVLYWNGLLIF